MSKKTKSPKLITLAEASERTGISRQTLTNWLDSKVINGLRTSTSIWIAEDCVRHIEETSDFKSLDSAISELKVSMEQKKDDILKSCDELTDTLNSICCVTEHMQNSIDRISFIRIMIKVFGEDLSDREQMICEQLFNGRIRKEIAKSFGMTTARIGALIEKVFCKIQESAFRADSIYEQNRILREENRVLGSQNNTLRNAYSDAKKEIEALEERKRVNEYCEKDYSVMDLLNLPIDEVFWQYGLRSVRAYNVIVKDHANDFYTLKDIVSLEKNELLRYRNMGKKSINAIEEFLDELGLSFGMDISKMEREYADSIVNSEEVPAA